MNVIDFKFRLRWTFFLGMAFASTFLLAQSQDKTLSIAATPLFLEGPVAATVAYHSASGNLPERISFEIRSFAEFMELSREDPLLSLYTKPPDESHVPPVFGREEDIANGVAFYPQFPLQAGIPYYILVRANSLGREPSDNEESPCIFTFTIPKEIQEPVASVKAVYPSASELPENLLKFYIHFTHPMSGGDAYSHIRLLDEAGEAIELPFLELGEELWDRQNLRLTLLFDPGRIKSGLMPRREEGAVLENGKHYTLQILSTWKDDQGRPLRESFEKRFIAIKPDGESPTVDNWELSQPEGNSKSPLRIDFPEPLDEALLQRVIEVLHKGGQPVTGRLMVEVGERSWIFNPDEPWRSGRYLLRVETVLEDLAGNSIGRPFEVDLEESEHRRPDTFVYREFELR